MEHATFTIASMGHPQHGKSSIMGALALGFRQEHSLDALLKAVTEKIEEIGQPQLRYALIFDLPKADFALQERRLKEKGPTRTFSRAPGWLGCAVEGIPIMFVDEPGHTHFLRYIVGATLRTDIAILVLDTKAFLKDYDETTAEFGTDCFSRRETHRGVQVPFMLRLDRQRRAEAARGTRRGDSSVAKTPWSRQVCANLLNYVALADLFAIQNVVVAVHQLDREGFREEAFNAARDRFMKLVAFLEPRVSMRFVPTAVLAEHSVTHNVLARSDATPWYSGPTLSDAILEIARGQQTRSAAIGPLRLEVDRFALGSPHLRYSPPPRVFGRVDSGVVSKGDTVRFQPLGIEARVKQVRLRDPATYLAEDPYWDRAAPILERAAAGTYVSLALGGKEIEREADSRRGHWLGQVMSHTTDAPVLTRRLRATLMIVPPWWCETDISGANLLVGYRRVPCALDSWQPGHDSKWWQTMSVEISTESEVAVDPFGDGAPMGRIAIERESFMVAGGTITQVLPP